MTPSDETQAADDPDSSPETAAEPEPGSSTPAAGDTEPPGKEIGGRRGPDPTRYGDWEKNGRCIDF
ncbi:MAG: DUF1674 domain-containing protein [Woeseiaceae bacterium]|nr:DUF1674 domain-containing protein [Woeseiaceae bacterium]